MKKKWAGDAENKGQSYSTLAENIGKEVRSLVNLE